MNKIDMDTLKESFGRVSYTQTAHEYEIQFLDRKVSILKWMNIILTGITFGGILSVILIDSTFLELVTAILSTISLALATYQLSFNPEEKKANHRVATKELLVIREKYKYLISDALHGSKSKEEILRERDLLLTELSTIYKFSPNTSNKAYKRAQRAIQKEEEQTFNIGEVDKILPASLRKGK